jgi:hypothetical protein
MTLRSRSASEESLDDSTMLTADVAALSSPKDEVSAHPEALSVNRGNKRDQANPTARRETSERGREKRLWTDDEERDSSVTAGHLKCEKEDRARLTIDTHCTLSIHTINREV